MARHAEQPVPQHRGAYAMVRPGCMREQWSVLLPMMESGVIDPPFGATYAVDDFG